jgi:hypothetical protein
VRPKRLCQWKIDDDDDEISHIPRFVLEVMYVRRD